MAEGDDNRAVVVAVPARLASSRLPGKVMAADVVKITEAPTVQGSKVRALLSLFNAQVFC